MKVELHLHTSRYSACSKATPAELMERMIQAGYEAVFITEHDAVWGSSEIAQLQAGFPDISIFPGIEISIGQQGMQHLLVLGTTDPVYMRLDETKDILEKARAERHLTVLAHPFRWEQGAAMLADGLRPDAMEHLTNNHTPGMAKISIAAAERLDMPLVNSGDVHGLDFLNRFWIETDQPIIKASDIRPAVLNRAYVNRIGK